MTKNIPSGNISTPKSLGAIVRKQRKSQAITQVELASLCGVGVRFISDLENGKTTVEIGKVLQVVESLGLKLTLEARGWATATETADQPESSS
jgi:y4mF family transcriptional regulator